MHSSSLLVLLKGGRSSKLKNRDLPGDLCSPLRRPCLVRGVRSVTPKLESLDTQTVWTAIVYHRAV